MAETPFRRPPAPWEGLQYARILRQAGHSYQTVVGELTAHYKAHPEGLLQTPLEAARAAVSWIWQAHRAGERLTANMVEDRHRSVVYPLNPRQSHQYQLIVQAKIHFVGGGPTRNITLTLNTDVIPTADDLAMSFTGALAHNQLKYGARAHAYYDTFVVVEAYGR